MQNKQQELEALQKKHIHDLWNDDLEALLAALTKQEEQDEADRQSHKNK